MPRPASPVHRVPAPPYRRVAVVGVGLLGGSIALALKQRGLAEHVVGVARTPDRAAHLGGLDLVDSVESDREAGLRDADVVVIATPVGAVAQAVGDARRFAADGALVTDVGSTKAEIVSAVAGLTAGADREEMPRFVGAHPLAGDTQSGPEAARADLLDGSTTVVTPSEATPAKALNAARTFWRALGSRVIEMAPVEHDRRLALTSHTPHVAASAVAATTPADALALAATGWADTTRIASGSPALWRDILLANRGPVAEALRGLAKEIEAYAVALDEGDGDTIETLLKNGKQRRDALGN